MSEQTRPRPRPRPKPKPLAKPAPSTASQQAGPSTTPIPSSSTAVAPSSPQQIQDEDEMFMRNRTRTSMTWKKLEEINKGGREWSCFIPAVHSLCKGRSTRRASDHDSEEDTSPRSRKHKNQTALPRWQRDKNLIRYVRITYFYYEPRRRENRPFGPHQLHVYLRVYFVQMKLYMWNIA
jgi:hypothetical protein